MAVSFDVVYEMLMPMWVEISFLAFFAVGFTFLRLDKFTSQPHRTKFIEVDNPVQKTLGKKVDADTSLGRFHDVVASWRAVKSDGPTRTDTLKLVAQAFTKVEPSGMTEIVDHMIAHPAELAHPRAATCILDAIARSGQVSVMHQVAETFRQLNISFTPQVYEVLIGGYAAVGDEKKVSSICKEIKEQGQTPSARGYSLAIKGLLKHNLLDGAITLVKDMRQAGFFVPPFAVTLMLSQASQKGRVAEVFEQVKHDVTLSSEAIVCIFDNCLKNEDVELARAVEKLAHESKVPFLVGAYDALLKLYTMAGDEHVLELFQSMQKSGCHISEGLCVGLLARCAEKKFLCFAEEIVSFCQSRQGMTVYVYSALMKVYAHSGHYDKACDLYGQLLADGLEPDLMMYGCLMKFAAECGRTELSRQLSEKAPSLDIQNYMSLIRAAGRDRDVKQAFAVLGRLKASGVRLDVGAYNCVLDVCASTGDMQEALELVKEMREVGTLDIITYNTLLKGHCSKRDIRSAKALLQEMKREGQEPNDISYNLLLNASVSAGDFQEAWNTVEVMQQNGFVDHYTLSIMMKAMKKVHNGKHLKRALELLSSTGIKACSDEVLLNTVVEACTRNKDRDHLENILEEFSASGLRPSVSTYGSLIKAAGVLKRVDRCWELWREAVDDRKLDPSEIAMGCMLDALVCNGCLEDAVTLFDQWKSCLTPNTVMYSTLAKGFATARQSSRAMALWHDMRSRGIGVNTVVCNALIDAQARCGCIDEITQIVTAMEKDGCKPDVITFSTIMKGYCVKGDLDKAYDVFRSTQESGLVTDAIIYNTLLDGCLRHNRPDLADQLIIDMEKNNITPSNFTLGILVKMYGRRHQLDKAFAVAESLSARHGFATNFQVKTCLIAACINNRAIDRALKVFKELKAQNGSDFKAYGVVIAGCVRYRRFAEAVALVEEAYGVQDGAPHRVLPAGQVLENDRLEQLLHALRQQGLMESIGQPLLRKLRDAKVPDVSRLWLLASVASQEKA